MRFLRHSYSTDGARVLLREIALFANGTLAKVIALQALRITGEIIVTPQSFVATASSLLWAGAKPVKGKVFNGRKPY